VHATSRAATAIDRSDFDRPVDWVCPFECHPGQRVTPSVQNWLGMGLPDFPIEGWNPVPSGGEVSSHGVRGHRSRSRVQRVARRADRLLLAGDTVRGRQPIENLGGELFNFHTGCICSMLGHHVIGCENGTRGLSRLPPPMEVVMGRGTGDDRACSHETRIRLIENR